MYGAILTSSSEMHASISHSSYSQVLCHYLLYSHHLLWMYMSDNYHKVCISGISNRYLAQWLSAIHPNFDVKRLMRHFYRCILLPAYLDLPWHSTCYGTHRNLNTNIAQLEPFFDPKRSKGGDSASHLPLEGRTRHCGDIIYV